MLSCDICQKGMKKIAFSRHKKGSSGAGGTWKLRAQITKREQRPNLHTYHGVKLCTKCLRMAKAMEAKAPKETSKENQGNHSENLQT